uniref:Uncharacterized protein n=1 Tax=Grammatophora oceanica TaxID=210454 RepID=A0A7S1VKV3_9STRA|mmetsp:Transcript_49154/g.73292  ORF Transcript_49154/g.73292 Transcript_49154/m.73292 type:complete len:200 (+) Transcript_49154:110-709(+)|eukprot:CAMPEP_0194034536 /NCGR_PEP_ID=MMETSP0009_2-20130614/6950_1 /TAXON_ID=210454 /ORGANISM="Grammatophora oceanica, Strain CCMP 410" /LENGTH=199 /DNA_ID=CAMNT_0038675495 /DNA_START=33 /DNA_END=632 /DNA_ORIENTATION=+
MKILTKLVAWMTIASSVPPFRYVESFAPSHQQPTTLRRSENTALSFSAKDAENFWRKQSKNMLATLLAVSFLAPISADARPSVFTNDYADPFHPLCERHILVSKDLKTFHYSGTAVGPKDDPVRRGCSPDEVAKYGLRQGAFDGLLLSETQISAGDGIHEGVWEPANSAKTKLGYEEKDGIRWNDGNKWVVLKPEKSSK